MNDEMNSMECSDVKNTKTKSYIYVALVKAHTGLGAIARALFRYEYTHIAVCMEEPLQDFVTFSRRKHYAPFDCGFMHETLDCYAYGDHKNVKLKVFKVPVTDRNRARIERYINKIENDKDYIFNVYSMATMGILHGFRIYKAENCMSFVSRIVEMSGAVFMDKPFYKYNIKELDALLKPYMYREELFYPKEKKTLGYMDKIPAKKNICMFLSLNGKLIQRILTKRSIESYIELERK
ncbi:hypothetical protein [Butyrivibrio proteoclasticus]|uniref:hypothetical protein n=1 Tax=Butyrivibrio proteoclasticus TaxID=43305 RepID=UPI000685B7CD|nr:hypothetical protein [Butyrivibrio proteoclasticus]